jgi:hypothetical protein
MENAECERALPGLAKDSDESIRDRVMGAIRYSKVMRRETRLAIEVMREIRAMPLPDGAEVLMTAESPKPCTTTANTKRPARKLSA